MKEPDKRKRWQHGRPRLDSQSVRHVVLRLRVNTAELTAIQEKANEMHMPVGRWLRQAALSRQLPARPVPEINRQLYAAITRIGNNINQIAREVHMGRVQISVDNFEEMKTLLRKTKIALLGLADDRQDS